MGFLTREAILAVQDRKVEAIEVPEWGGTVHMRSASIREWQRAVDAARLPDDKLDGVKYASAVLAECLCDEAGNKLFTLADLEVIEGKSRIVVQRLFDKALALNGLGEAAQKELEGNSSPDGGASSSD